MSKNKYYQYYQPNKKDLKDKQGDCAIRSLTKFFNISWLEAFDQLVVYARETQQMINNLKNIELLMSSKNIPYFSVYKPKDKNKITVLDFAKEYKNGKYILYVRVGFGTHLVCVEDGRYYDTWDCGKKYVYGYWFKEK